MAEGGDETARVDVQEGLRFLVRIDFDILVRDLLVLQGYPDALDEGAGGCQWVGRELRDVAYQNALPYSFRSSSLEWFLTVVKALPVAFLWYVFLEGSPPWLVSVILNRMVLLLIRKDGVGSEERFEQNEVLEMVEGRVQGYGKKQGNVRSLQNEVMNNVRNFE